MTRRDREACNQFSAAVTHFARRWYCLGGASDDEIKLAVIAWLEGWIESAKREIPGDTQCPYRR
jgi:hypothetical protein